MTNDSFEPGGTKQEGMMKKFIFQASLFVLPFFLVHFFNSFYYSKDRGDLARIGFLYTKEDRKQAFYDQESELPKLYVDLSESDLKEPLSYTAITIGDSFSDQGKWGFQNYLARHDSLTVAHLPWGLSPNPVQTLASLVNGGFFDQQRVDYVILETVERDFADRFNLLDPDHVLNSDSLVERLHKLIPEKPRKKVKFFSSATLKLPLINLLYFFTPKPLDSKTYKVRTSKDLFLNAPKNLLFYYRDLDWAMKNSDPQTIETANEILNQLGKQLSQKGIKLIFMVCPDKYDFYFSFIKKRQELPKPSLFEKLEPLEKHYLYINSKNVLSENIMKYKSIYYYDDSHWSPTGARIIGDELARIIAQDRSH